MLSLKMPNVVRNLHLTHSKLNFARELHLTHTKLNVVRDLHLTHTKLNFEQHIFYNYDRGKLYHYIATYLSEIMFKKMIE
jgi:hypothetical protein